MGFIRNWMKEFLIIYLILTILMHLAAGEQYKKYLKFFSGIILLAVLISPALRLLGSLEGKRELESYYEEFWENLDSAKQESWNTDSFAGSQVIQKYEDTVAADIKNAARKMGISVSSIRVQLSDDFEIEKITIWMDVQEEQEMQDKMAAYLTETYRLEEGRVAFEMVYGFFKEDG